MGNVFLVKFKTDTFNDVKLDPGQFIDEVDRLLVRGGKTRRGDAEVATYIHNSSSAVYLLKGGSLYDFTEFNSSLNRAPSSKEIEAERKRLLLAQETISAHLASLDELDRARMASKVQLVESFSGA